MRKETMEIGPTLFSQAPDFTIADAEGHDRSLDDFMGQRGVLMAFISNIWDPASIRRILYLQRHFRRFRGQGYEIVVVIEDRQEALWTFYMSSPMSVSVPMLADENGTVHQSYNMNHAGLVLVGKDHCIRAKWLMPDERVWPSARHILEQSAASV